MRTQISGMALGCVLAACNAPASALDWSGSYGGLNLGYGFGDVQTSNSGNPGPSVAAGGGAAAAVALANGLPSIDVHPRGFVLGGQLGHNWQSGSTVYGLEADLQGAWIKGTANASGGAPVAGFPANPVVSSVSQTNNIDYLGTLRGRVGYARDNWLAYATGGLAYGQLRTEITATQAIVGGPATLGVQQQPSPAISTAQRAGWTLGGGVEYSLSAQWSAKAEYLYYDLGSTTTTMDFIATNKGPFASSGNMSTAKWTGSLVRVGLNYHF